MFKVNEYIIYNSQYVCVVNDICAYMLDDALTDYYVLHPVYERNSVIKIPVGSTKVQMRRILSEDEASSLLARIADIDFCWFDDKNIRSQEFKKALRSGQCEEWLRLTKTLMRKKSEQMALGKKLCQADKTVLDLAESLLYGELALALGQSYEKVASYIAQQMTCLNE